MSVIQPIITHGGLSALWSAQSHGLQAEITHLAIGSAGYVPSAGQTALAGEWLRVPVASSDLVSDGVRLNAAFDGAAAGYVREVGVFLSTGVLLAVWSDPAQLLTYKAGGDTFLFSFTLDLTALPVGSVTVTATGPELNLSLAGPLATLVQGQAQQAVALFDTMNRQVESYL
jgi:hypothetical protein